MLHYRIHHTQSQATVHIQGVKNNVYNVSGMIEEVKTNTFLFDKTLASHQIVVNMNIIMKFLIGHKKPLSHCVLPSLTQYY